ncbi:S9 family peptidase, partial [Winogradskyella sp.]|nr:S9 family peptidase [Winogradskyella sp.]
MKLRHFIALVGFLTTSLIYCQDKQITLNEIWGGEFRTEGMQALHSMNNGKQYSVLNVDRQTRNATIDIYDYKTLEKVKTLVSSADIAEIQGFFDYSFSTDESKIILTTKSTPVFRRST